MKKAVFAILMAVVAISLAGCEDYDEQPLHFVNSSDYVVTVTSLSIEWTGFALAPGQERKLSDIRDVDYTFSPDKWVQEGSASTERYIVFVNAEEAVPVEPVTVVIQQP